MKANQMISWKNSNIYSTVNKNWHYVSLKAEIYLDWVDFPFLNINHDMENGLTKQQRIALKKEQGLLKDRHRRRLEKFSGNFNEIFFFFLRSFRKGLLTFAGTNVDVYFDKNGTWSEGIADCDFTIREILDTFLDAGITVPSVLLKGLENEVQKRKAAKIEEYFKNK